VIKFYTNQELSQKLNINLARWKRWSREFLPPDPLGGLQSGYARQYNPDEAFTVFLGGYLVGELKFTIPEARRILHDLHDWLTAQKFYFDYTGDARSNADKGSQIQFYEIAIGRFLGVEADFIYFTKGVLTDDSIVVDGIPMRRQRFVESIIPSGTTAEQVNAAASYRVINISILRSEFLDSLEGA